MSKLFDRSSFSGFIPKKKTDEDDEAKNKSKERAPKMQTSRHRGC